MESIMLTTLEFRVTVPYSLRFVERVILLCQCLFSWSDDSRSIDTTGTANTNEISAYALFVESIYYFLELTLQEYVFLSYLPSVIGCAAVSLALQLFQGRTWKTE
uniref:Cyclin-A2-1 n=1 Tax=Lygus hesperus TaxID=30085 RepID=A0A0A9YFK8_LYGHE